MPVFGPDIDPVRLADLLRAFEGFERRRPPMLLNLPNLRVNRVTALPVAAGVAISANIANTGNRASGDFNLVTSITRDGMPDQPRWQRVPSMPPQTAQDLLLVILEEIDGMAVCATVVADPPSAERPLGEVLESDEQDNIDQLCFLVPFPQQGIPKPEDFKESPDQCWK